jgi:hypothetical protein
MNWTEENLRNYTQRRLAQEQRARERMQGIVVVQQLPVSLLREVLADPERTAQAKAVGWDIEEMRRIVEKAEQPTLCPWCGRPVEKVSEPAGCQTWYFYRHTPDAPRCQGMWTVIEEKP